MVLFATVSRLTRYSITSENHVFSVFYVTDVTCFFKSFQLPSLKSLEPVSTQITILFKPLHFQTRYMQNLFKVCASNTLFIFPLKIMQKFSSGLWKLGIFRKWVEVLCFPEYFFKIFDWVVSHLLFVHLCWPIVAVWACIQVFFTVFLHCS